MVIEFFLNGKSIQVDVEGEKKLVHFLREDMDLTGTKIGCEIGECGACSVLMDGRLVKSCLIPVKKVNGKHITTIEGLSSDDGRPGDLQQAFLDNGAVQCGYCTPGMIIAAEALLRENPTPDRSEIQNAISRNLCRCTGYQQIIDSIETAAIRRNSLTLKAQGIK